MKINFRRRSIETTCTFTAYYLMLLSIFLFTFYRFDNIFGWDIFSNQIEQVIEALLLPLVGVIVLFCIVTSFMINFSLVSISIEEISKKANSVNSDEIPIKIGRKTKKTTVGILLVLFICLLGFHLFDKWQTNRRINQFEEVIVTTKNLAVFDSIVSAINYNDTLVYKIDQNGYQKLSSDSSFGISNRILYQHLIKRLIIFNEFVEENLKSRSMQIELVTNFNGTWVKTNSLGSRYQNQPKNQKKILNKYDLINHLFDGGMEDIKNDNIDGYEIYYSINNSRSFNFVIFLKSNPLLVINFGNYRVYN